MATMQTLTGVSASPGLFSGPLAFIGAPAGDADDTGDPKLEADRLRSAIDSSSEALGALIAGLDGDEDGAAILEFQLAMLADDELSDPAFDLITGGQSAFAAWTGVLDAQVKEYAEADDGYFRARSADIADIRNRVLAMLSGKTGTEIPGGSILVGADITPSLFLEVDWSQGGAIAVAEGSPSSHVAMLARAKGIPMITGLGHVPESDHENALVDAGNAEMVLSPDQQTRRTFQQKVSVDLERRKGEALGLSDPAVTADGRRIAVMVNIAGPKDLDAIDIGTCDGVGLMRSEFLFYGRDDLPGEEDQYQAYRQVLRWAGEKPVVIRTLDAGGDKPIAGVTLDESNPFLGCRGIRLSLTNPDLFKIQLRALCRAARHGNLKIMVPMVTVPEEISKAQALLDEALDELRSAGKEGARPDLGIMVEVPAVAICPDLYTSADFFSIGSNDLAQYVTAASRDSTSVAELNTARSPSVLNLIGNVARVGAELEIPVSLCGDAGSDLDVLPELISRQITTISVAPAALASVKAAIRKIGSVADGV